MGFQPVFHGEAPCAFVDGALEFAVDSGPKGGAIGVSCGAMVEGCSNGKGGDVRY